MDRKKPRLQGPDGFQKSKPTSRYKPPESITEFVSTFDNPPPPSPPRKKPHAQRNLDFQAKAGPSKPFQSKPLSSAQPPLKALRPPVFLPPPDAEPFKSTKTAGTRLGALQPTLKAAPAPPEKPRYLLRPPPVPVPQGTKPSVPLKPLAPPPLLPATENVSTSPKKPMKTIFTTSVAQATDPTKVGGGAELLSLFLQQHGHDFTSATDRELQRGVIVSPDKRSRGKDPKFLRGGLAERVQHQISCVKTDFTLWKRQMEQKLESGRKFGSDMQLRIMRVLDVARPTERPRFTVEPRSGLALCRLTRRHPLTSGDLTLGTYVVLFHFAPTQGGRSAVSSMEVFEEGKNVMVWLPWQKVALAGIEESVRLRGMFRALDALTPPHSLLVVSRFVIDSTT